MVTIKAVRIYDTILEEEKCKIRFIRNGNEFEGALFFAPDFSEEVKEVIESKTIDRGTEKEEIIEAIRMYIEMAKRNGIKTFKDTEKTMMHWQFMNGFSTKIFPEAYK